MIDSGLFLVAHRFGIFHVIDERLRFPVFPQVSKNYKICPEKSMRGGGGGGGGGGRVCSKISRMHSQYEFSLFQFTSVMFVDEKSKQKAVFTKNGSAITLLGNYNKKAGAYGLWTPKGVASTQYKYQVLICDTSFYKGLFISGYTNCYKHCNSWCNDFSSPYFRTAATSKTYAGVAFNQQGAQRRPNRLISAGIR